MGQRVTSDGGKQNVKRILVVFPFGDASTDEIEAAGSQVIPGKKNQEGKSSDRALAYYAGRAALKFAFDYMHQKAYVRPAEGYGYLEVVDEKGELVPGLFANVTHTETMAVAAVGDYPLGIDVERLDRPVGRVLPRVASSEEMLNVDRWRIELDGKLIPSGIALWCAKEAYSKALGLGLGGGLDKVELSLESDSFSVMTGLIGPHVMEAPRIELQLFSDYIIALCCEKSALDDGFVRLQFGVGSF